jgi:hypothetical protein
MVATPQSAYPTNDGVAIRPAVVMGLAPDGKTPVPGTISVGGLCARVSTTFNRPANTTAYATGQLVANNTVAGSVTVLAFDAARFVGGTGQILRARIRKSSPNLTNASFRLHLFRAAPVVGSGDGAAMSITGAAEYFGALDVTVDQAFTDGAVGIGVPVAGPLMIFATVADSQMLYGVLEARGAYVPASAETFAIVLEVVRD